VPAAARQPERHPRERAPEPRPAARRAPPRIALLARRPSSDTRFLLRAEREALNLCVTWPDWNTVQHALDTGEALLATGLAYDWARP
jgi:hypothetical protein